MRVKEDADDYRYFLEPDLVPLAPSAEWIQAVRDALPMLPGARRARLAAATGFPADGEAVMVVVERGQDDYVLAITAAGGNPARALIYVKEAFAEAGSESERAGRRCRRADDDGDHAARSRRRKPRRSSPRSSPMVEAMPRRSLRPTASRRWTTRVLEAMIDQVIADNAPAWAKYCSGEDKALGASLARR